MKTLILGGGMFGFAIARHLGKNNPETNFYLYEKDEGVFESLKTHRENPYFFQGTKLPENIFFEEDLQKNVGSYDLIIIAIPAQFVVGFLGEFRGEYKNGVTFLNLSKGINNESLKTIGEGLEEIFYNPSAFQTASFNTKGSNVFFYNYAVLSGGMIAQELVDEKILGADIAITQVGTAGLLSLQEKVKGLFQSENLDINLTQASPKSVELFGALKNITAICIGYYMGKGLSYSSLGYYVCKLLDEEKKLIKILGGGEYFEFSDYSLGGDIVATCFGNSRNRYLGELLGQGKTAQESLDILQQEKKTAEGYFTLQGVLKLIEKEEGFDEVSKIGKVLF